MDRNAHHGDAASERDARTPTHLTALAGYARLLGFDACLFNKIAMFVLVVHTVEKPKPFVL